MITQHAEAQEASPEALVNGLNAVFGQHGARASHAKGLCVTGTFTPEATAKSLSKVAQFAGVVPLLGRFSMGGGNPKVPDTARPAPRGLALRFDLGSGNAFDLVMLSTPMFFAKTPEQMLGFLQARFPGPDGKPDPAKIKAFAAANPDTTKQGAWLSGRPIPASYAGANYWGIHAFTLTNAQGAATVVKFKAVPRSGEIGMTDEEAKTKSQDFYSDDLKQRLSAGPVAFDLISIIGESGDPTDDPTAVWPEDARKAIKLGTIALSAIEAHATCDAIVFDPANLVDGIAGPANDAIFAARSPAYAVSLSRRTK
ncbi:MAG: catalase family peroxidase [Hyphomicrobiaceae bacterium]|nr:catalase family peroxidase [Hyphomicrobiaceae bacterium]